MFFQEHLTYSATKTLLLQRVNYYHKLITQDV